MSIILNAFPLNVPDLELEAQQIPYDKEPGAAASSARLYWESFRRLNLEPVHIPVGCSIFPKEIFRSSRRWVEKRFTQLVYWNEPDG